MGAGRIPNWTYAKPGTWALAGVVVAAVLLRLPLLGGGQIDYDEGVYWESLRALAAGHPLFSSVYSSQPPAFLLLMLPLHLLSGGAIAAERLTVLALAAAGVVATWRLGMLLGGSLALGLLAAALLAADPLYLRESVTLQADGPAVALATVAVALAAEAASRQASPLAFAAGAVLALAVLTKLLAIAAAPALVVVLLQPQRDWRLATASGLGALAGAACLLLPFAPAWPEVWRQAVGLHLGARTVPLGGLDGWTLLRELPIAGLGLAGLFLCIRSAPAVAAAAAAWIVPAATVLAVNHPLWPHHAVLLMPPLALLGGGLATLVPARRLPLVAGALLLGAIASTLWVRSIELPGPASSVAALRHDTGPDALVITDDQYAAALAGRDIPPSMVDTSMVRIRSGDLTAAQVEAEAASPEVDAVLLSGGRLSGLPGLEDWLSGQYPMRRDLGGGRVLYLRPA